MKNEVLWSASVVAIFSTLLGCSPVWEARLYPIGADSEQGVLSMYLSHQSGLSRGSSGTAKVTLPSGEVLEGDYSALDETATAIGTTVANVQAGSTTASGTAAGVVTATPGTHPAVASLVGNRGTNMHCQLFFGASWQEGSGTCETSAGAQYRVHIRPPKSN